MMSRNNVLMKVLETYAASFRLIFKYPVFIYVSIISNTIITASNWGIGYLPKMVVSLLSLLSLLGMILTPMILILLTLQIEKRIDPGPLYPKIRADFWKFIGQLFAGFFLAFLYSSPTLFLLLVSSQMENKAPFWALVFLSSALFQYLALGSIGMAQRMLLEKGVGLFKNSLNGLRMINTGFSYYLVLALVQMILTTGITVGSYFLGYFLGSAITGVDLFPRSGMGYYEFLSNARPAVRVPVVPIVNLILSTIVTPLNSVVVTLSYLHFKARTKFRLPFRKS